MTRLHLLISGFVTNVGFRYFVQGKALELGLGGWVRNTQDEKVEVDIEGKEEEVDEMLKLCQEGPAGAWVKEVKILEREKIEKKSERFEIVL